ncbi:MAG: glycoside hydrolase family 18 protein, partial [Clostridia bacterium]|nr:glycoside hydrolase family 18 protein [Clostridia bacterium]
ILCCVMICPALALSGCSMSSTPNAISKNYENVAKGYALNRIKGGEGDSITFTFKSAKTFNVIVLKENSGNITNYELYANGEMLYKSDFIGKYKYCSHKTVTTDSITLKVVACDGEWSIKDFEAYNIGGTAQDDFQVTSYILVERAYTLNVTSAPQMSVSTEFNIFGSVYLDADGHLHLQDYLFDGQSVDGAAVLRKAIENIRKYNPAARITLTILGNLDFTGDGLDTQSRHSKAMGDNAQTLIQECLGIAQEYGFDGVSFDYEYPYTYKANKIYGNFLQKLKTAMGEGKRLSAAFSLWNLSIQGGFPIDKLDFLDSIELMAYDAFDERGNHASFYETCANALYKLKKRGVEISIVNLGLPFYSRPADGAAFWGDYASAADKLGVWGNSLELDVKIGDGEAYKATCYYNGVQMIYDKTCYALDTGAGGVMVWHYSCDTSDSELSLYRSINAAITSRK